MEQSIGRRRTAAIQVIEHRTHDRHPEIWLCPNCRIVHPIHHWHHGTVDGREYCDFCDAKRVILNHMKSTSWRKRERYCGICGWRGPVEHERHY